MCSVKTPTSRARVFRLFVAFPLFGFISGISWMAALMPVHVTGPVWYDLSRYGFALITVVALVGLFSREWRGFGLPAAVAGAVLGIVSWAVIMPMNLSPRDEQYFLMIIFGGPLAIAAAASVCFAVARQVSDFRNSSPDDGNGPSAAPRRFGVGTLMFIIVITSLFLAVTNWVGMAPAASLTIGGFLGIIGGLQMLLHRLPRAASVGSGAVLLPATLAVVFVMTGAGSHPVLGRMTSTTANLVFTTAHLAIIGALCGYVAGVLIAGLFLSNGRRE